MNVSLSRIILFVHDVKLLAAFYRDTFGMQVVEEIAGEWAVLQAGNAQLALHRIGVAHRASSAPAPGRNSNAKVVLSVSGDLADLREQLVSAGVAMGNIMPYGSTGPLCDGTDPEGNVFQLAAT